MVVLRADLGRRNYRQLAPKTTRHKTTRPKDNSPQDNSPHFQKTTRPTLKDNSPHCLRPSSFISPIRFILLENLPDSCFCCLKSLTFLKVYFAVNQFLIITSGVGWMAKFVGPKVKVPGTMIPRGWCRG